MTSSRITYLTYILLKPFAGNRTAHCARRPRGGFSAMLVARAGRFSAWQGPRAGRASGDAADGGAAGGARVSTSSEEGASATPHSPQPPQPAPWRAPRLPGHRGRAKRPPPSLARLRHRGEARRAAPARDVDGHAAA
jgi:hypothetical protein